MTQWIRENYSSLEQKIPEIDSLTKDQLIEKLGSDGFYTQTQELEEEVNTGEEGAVEGEVPVHEFNHELSEEMEKLQQMKKELIDKYVYEDEIEKKEQILLRQIQQARANANY